MSGSSVYKRSSVAFIAVLVAALGYFVDIYDLVLFSALRIPSLKGLGVTDPAALKSTGKLLLDVQLLGMILGGLLFGVVGDKRGRLYVMFGSILLYSAANLANAFVTTVPQYAILRFVAGVGLAGELGAGITLVSELLPTNRRGIGTTIVASVGLSGALAAGALSEALMTRFGPGGWRYAFGLGGIMGLVLLFLRVGVLESGMFHKAQKADVPRGDIRMLFSPLSRFVRFLRVIVVGMPIWFVGGVIFVFSPELGGALGLADKPTGARTIFWGYFGVVLGDVASGLLSQLLRSRKQVIRAYLIMLGVSVSLLLSFGGRSIGTYYVLVALIGFATGYWVLFVTTASEQFGTNLRATVTTSAPNFVRGTAIPITTLWLALQGSLSVIGSTLVVGALSILAGLVALAGMKESFSSDLDTLERP